MDKATDSPGLQLCLRRDCEHHEERGWLRPPERRPVYAAAGRARLAS